MDALWQVPIGRKTQALWSRGEAFAPSKRRSSRLLSLTRRNMASLAGLFGTSCITRLCIFSVVVQSGDTLGEARRRVACAQCLRSIGCHDTTAFRKIAHSFIQAGVCQTGCGRLVWSHFVSLEISGLYWLTS